MSVSTLRKKFLIVALAAVATCCLQSTMQAALLTSIVNGGFEAGTGGLYSNVPSGTVPGAANPGWNGVGGYANGAGVWYSAPGPGGLHAIAPTFPAFTGVRAGSLIANAPQAQPANNEAILYQSLGLVDASDIGKTFRLSADLGARGFANRTYTGDMTVRFGTGASAATPIGTPGVVNVVANPGLLAVPPAFGLLPATGTFTPTVADIGTEIYAAVHLLNFSPYGGNENQYVVDNVALTVVPEPASLFLVVASVCGALCHAARTRSRV